MEKKIDLFVQPGDFFRERVCEVMQRQNFEASEVAEFYLVDLLARFMVSANLFEPLSSEVGENQQEQPLAILFLKAQNISLELSERIKYLKKLGDTSLYISGFFGDSLSRKVIDLDYYREMGSIAYRILSGTIRDDSFQELYTELHAKFSGFVGVLNEISHETLVQDNQNLLRLYEVYVKTGSTVARRQLSEKGLPTPQVVEHPPGKPKKHE